MSTVKKKAIKQSTKEHFEKNWEDIFKEKKKSRKKPKLIRCNNDCGECEKKTGTCLIIADG